MTTAKIGHRKAPKMAAYGMALYTVNTKQLYDFQTCNLQSLIYRCNIGRKSEIPVHARKAYGRGRELQVWCLTSLSDCLQYSVMRLSTPQSWSGCFEEGINLLLMLGFEPWTIQFVAKLLYQLCFPGICYNTGITLNISDYKIILYGWPVIWQMSQDIHYSPPHVICQL